MSSMPLSDSHCHLHMLDLTEFGGSLDPIITAAQENQVEHLLCVGTTLEDIPAILKIAERYTRSTPANTQGSEHASHTQSPVNVRASVGLHPNESVTQEPSVEALVALAKHPKVVAVGETGLDYFRTDAQQPWQIDRFRTHIAAAKQARKPLIIHTRAARQDTLTILKEERADEIGGVFHCFTEDWDTAKAALELGFYISFSGIVTFKNASDLQAVAKQIPIDRLLIETDSPYLAPMPHRGKMNQPSYVKHVAEFLAQLRNETFEYFAGKTTENYLNLFK